MSPSQEEPFEVYTRVALTEIKGVLVGIEAKLDALTRTDRDHEVRLREIEKWKWKSTGIAMVVSALVSAVLTVILTLGIGGT